MWENWKVIAFNTFAYFLSPMPPIQLHQGTNAFWCRCFILLLAPARNKILFASHRAPPPPKSHTLTRSLFSWTYPEQQRLTIISSEKTQKHSRTTGAHTLFPPMNFPKPFSVLTTTRRIGSTVSTQHFLITQCNSIFRHILVVFKGRSFLAFFFLTVPKAYHLSSRRRSQLSSRGVYEILLPYLQLYPPVWLFLLLELGKEGRNPG